MASPHETLDDSTVIWLNREKAIGLTTNSIQAEYQHRCSALNWNVLPMRKIKDLSEGSMLYDEHSLLRVITLHFIY